MKSVTLNLKNDADSNDVHITGNFSDTDLILLERYTAGIDRIHKTSLLMRGLPSIKSMKWSVSEGMVFSCAPYNDSELFELLHVLRHVVLVKEKASFENTLTLLENRFNNHVFGAQAEALRHLFKNGQYNSYMQITVGGQPLFDNSLLNMWLNGTQYHTDEDKAAAWSELEATLNTENARALVMTQIHDRVTALFELERLVQYVLAQ